MSREVERCLNLVFTRDSGVVTNAGVIVMRMGLPSRRRETPITEAAYKVLGVPMVLKLEEPGTYNHSGLF